MVSAFNASAEKAETTRSPELAGLPQNSLMSQVNQIGGLQFQQENWSQKIRVRAIKEDAYYQNLIPRFMGVHMNSCLLCSSLGFNF